MDSAQLAAACDYLTAHYPHFDSLLIVRQGHLIFERYTGARGPDTLHNVKSVTKSVLSALVGIAIQTGDLAGPDETLGVLLPEYFTSASDPRQRDIRVCDLLTMRSGLEWNESGSSTARMTASPHWLRYMLDQPVAHDPGSRFNYSTGDTQVLSAVLHQATGMTALAFADLVLFEPLGITRRTWPTDPQGHTVGGAELALLPRDVAKFGTLYLNGGTWDGRQIVPAAWVAESTRQHVRVMPPGARDCAEVGYGYLWWLRSQGDYASYMAVGYGGQFIYVIPALDLVIALTGDTRAAPEGFSDNRMLCQFNFVEDFIVPAVEG